MTCECEAEKIAGRYVCMAKSCPHRLEGGGCKLGKISLTCDNNDCQWNIAIAPGVSGCKCMDLHLDADGECIGVTE